MSANRRPRKTRKTAEERRAQVAALADRLDEYAEDMDEGQIAYITALHDGYSARNAMLIAMQAPEATDVSGFKAWQDRGRSVLPRPADVAPGEWGIKILAPAGQRDAVDADPEAGTEAKAARKFFKLAYVFDVAQTEPLEVAQARWAAQAAA